MGTYIGEEHRGIIVEGPRVGTNGATACCQLLGRLPGFIKSLIGITIIVWRFSVKVGELVYRRLYAGDRALPFGYCGGYSLPARGR